MKRSAGFKLRVPEVLDTFATYGLPIYICIERPKIEITFKPSNSPVQDTRIKNVLAAVIPYVNNAASFFEGIDIKCTYMEQGDDTALFAAVIIALFEENYMSESLHDVIEWLDERAFENCDMAICKTMITGGICLSGQNYHERIFGSSGLYIALKNREAECAISILDANISSLITTAFIKDRMPLLKTALQSFQDIAPLNHDEFVGQIFELKKDITVAFLSMQDPTFIKSGEWIGGINQSGIEIC